MPASRRHDAEYRSARSRRRAAAAFFAGVAVLAMASGCAHSADGGEPFSILATTPVLAALAKTVAVGAEQVRSLMPNDSDPHSYQPSARDRKAMLEAGLLVVNGGKLEEGLSSVIHDATREGVPTLTALDLVDPKPDIAGTSDPHFWLDPRRAAMFVDGLAAALEEKDPTHAGDYRNNAAVSGGRLDRLTSEARRILDVIPASRRLLVTNHDAYRYFADRFGFEVAGTIVAGRSSQSAPSAAHLAELANIMREHSICVVFGEENGSMVWAQSLAKEAGGDVSVVRLHAATVPAGSYERMIRENSQRIAGAIARCE